MPHASGGTSRLAFWKPRPPVLRSGARCSTWDLHVSAIAGEGGGGQGQEWYLQGIAKASGNAERTGQRQQMKRQVCSPLRHLRHLHNHGVVTVSGKRSSACLSPIAFPTSHAHPLPSPVPVACVPSVPAAVHVHVRPAPQRRQLRVVVDIQALTSLHAQRAQPDVRNMQAHSRCSKQTSGQSVGMQERQ